MNNAHNLEDYSLAVGCLARNSFLLDNPHVHDRGTLCGPVARILNRMALGIPRIDILSPFEVSANQMNISPKEH